MKNLSLAICISLTVVLLAATSCAETPDPGAARSPETTSTVTTEAATATTEHTTTTTASSDPGPATETGNVPEKKDPPTESNTLNLGGSPFTPAPFPDRYRYPYDSMRAFTLSNSSDHEITIGRVEVTNPAFSVSGCEGVVLRPAYSRDYCTIVVQFTPTAVGHYEGELQIHVPADNTVKTERLFFSYLPPTASATITTTSPPLVPPVSPTLSKSPL